MARDGNKQKEETGWIGLVSQNIEARIFEATPARFKNNYCAKKNKALISNSVPCIFPRKQALAFQTVSSRKILSPVVDETNPALAVKRQGCEAAQVLQRNGLTSSQRT